MKIKAKCIKETYTWDGDGEQHKFPYVKLGLVYTFDIEYGCCGRKTYWLDKTVLSNKQDYEFIDYCKRGLETKYFNEMFEIVK